MTLTCKIVLKDEVWCNFVGLSKEHLEFLWNKFAFLKEGAYFMPAVRLGRWDRKNSFL
jgi:hypothetical protein